MNVGISPNANAPAALANTATAHATCQDRTNKTSVYVEISPILDNADSATPASTGTKHQIASRTVLTEATTAK